MVYAKPSICLRKWQTWTPMGLWHRSRSLNLDQTTRTYYNQQKKRTCKIVDFAILADHRIKLKENDKKDMYLDLARELKKTMEHEGDNYTDRDWFFWYSHRRIIKRTGGLGGRRTSGNHPNYYIIEISQNTEKSPGDLRRLAVTQTPVKTHQLKPMWKTTQGVNNNNNNEQKRELTEL